MMFPKVLLTAVFLALCATPALAQDANPLGGTEGSVAGEFEGEPDAGRLRIFDETVLLYAKDQGLDRNSAAAQLVAQLQLANRLATVEERLGEASAGVWIEHGPRLRGVVRTADGAQVNEEVKRLIAAGDVQIDIVEGGTPVAELEKRLESALPRLQAIEGSGLAGVELDVTTGEFVLFFDESSEARAAPEARRRTEETARNLLGDRLRIETTKAPVGDHHTRGGANLSTCTSGFVVRHPSNGVTGYITAGHCGNNQTYFEFGGTSYSTSFVDEIRDSDQDVQWHTTPHIEEPRFYASITSSHRPLQGRKTRSQQVVGGYACHRGKTTGYSCGYIQTKNFAPTYPNACPGTTCSSVWVRVEGSSLKCAGGDSGGPWFIVYDAYGLNKGGSSSGTSAGDCNWAFYMASNYFGIDLVFD